FRAYQEPRARAIRHVRISRCWSARPITRPLLHPKDPLRPVGGGRLSHSQDRFHYRSHGSGVIAKPHVARSCQGLSESLRLSIHRRSRTPLTPFGGNSKTGRFTTACPPVKCESQQDGENQAS